MNIKNNKVLGLFISFIVSGVSSFAVINILTRTVSTSSFGNYTFTVAAAALVNAIFFQWIRIYVLRHASIGSGRTSDHLIDAISLYIKTVVLIFISAGIALPILTNYFKVDSYVVICLVVLAVGQGGYEITLAFIRAKDNVSRLSLVMGMRSLIWLALATASVLFFSDLFLLPMLLASYILAACFADKNLFKKLGKLREFGLIDRVSDFSVKSISSNDFVPVLSIGLVVLLPFAFKLVARNEYATEEFGRIVAYYDVVFLICSTPVLAVNYLCQTKLLRILDDIGNNVFKDQLGVNRCLKLFIIANCGAAIVAVLVLNYFPYLVLGSEFRLSNSLFVNYLLVGMFFLGVRYYWVDHYFYYKKLYKYQVFSNSIAIAPVFFTGFIGNLDVQDIALGFFIGALSSLVFSLWKIDSEYYKLLGGRLVVTLILGVLILLGVWGRG